MKTVAYSNPFVPPEWIAAWGLRPHWMQPQPAGARVDGAGPLLGVVQGVCPYTRAVLHAAISDASASAVVMTTTCDQMRHAAGLLARRSDREVFLLNVPRTWQTPTASQLYLDELKRLGRFLERLGGTRPPPQRLADVMLEYESARRSQHQQSLGNQGPGDSLRSVTSHPVECRTDCQSVPRGSVHGASVPDAIPLALVGGPLWRQDRTILDVIERAGGRVVLDATEGGERTLPAKFDRRRLEEDPLAELARAYFGSIPDPLRRPNHTFYEWLTGKLAARGALGLLLWRYVWCDIWHAELYRLKQLSPVPVLDVDVGHNENGSLGRTVGRVEAFLEMLSSKTLK